MNEAFVDCSGGTEPSARYWVALHLALRGLREAELGPGPGCDWPELRAPGAVGGPGLQELLSDWLAGTQSPKSNCWHRPSRELAPVSSRLWLWWSRNDPPRTPLLSGVGRGRRAGIGQLAGPGGRGLGRTGLLDAHLSCASIGRRGRPRYREAWPALIKGGTRAAPAVPSSAARAPGGPLGAGLGGSAGFSRSVPPARHLAAASGHEMEPSSVTEM